jgi:peptidoglycan/LPS O-acetylase OafA/YrhL
VARQAAPVASRDRRGQNRVLWLDGIRGAAALFVVLHHIWLTAWPSFPHNTGPWWLGWLLYGHMAVAVFIVVSGFSLALVPLSNGNRLPGGVRRFVRRRAWRILPPYWAALILSVIVTAWLLRPGLQEAAIAKSFVVHGVLVQDLVGSVSPNGALWSIAVEWQIYFAFPLILLLGRNTRLATAVCITVFAVLAAHEVAQVGPPFDKIDHVTPQFLALFALGVLAVHLGSGELATRLRRPLGATAIAALVAFVLIAATQGSEWMVDRFFWMDLLFGLGVACGLAVMHASGVGRMRRLLASRVALWLGLFSYSIYLVHDPIVGVLDKYVFGPMDLAPLATFSLTVALGLPVVLALCFGFHLLFEAPFLRRRDLGALRELPILRSLPRGRKPTTDSATTSVGTATAPTIVYPPGRAAGEEAAG